jgi:hypothetical protein
MHILEMSIIGHPIFLSLAFHNLSLKHHSERRPRASLYLYSRESSGERAGPWSRRLSIRTALSFFSLIGRSNHEFVTRVVPIGSQTVQVLHQVHASCNGPVSAGALLRHRVTFLSSCFRVNSLRNMQKYEFVTA